MKAPITALLLASFLVALPAPAQAETLHLKNGSQVRGKIVREDAKAFTVETPDGRRKVMKAEMETLATPDPVIAAVIGLVPGAGQIYVGDFPRGAFYFVMAAALGGGVWAATRQIRPSSPSTAAVAAIVAAEVPGILGAVDAYGRAADLSSITRYRIDYDE